MRPRRGRRSSASVASFRRKGVTLIEDKLNAGFWYSEDLFRQTPSFAALQGQPAFEQIVARSLEIMNGMETSVLRCSKSNTQPFWLR